jgi:sugar phosphate isomerase/epimerase
MEILFLCPRWGSESLEPREFISRVRKAGYDGIEVGLADDDTVADEVIALAKSEDMQVVTQHYATLEIDLEAHCAAFEKRLRRAASFQPLFINSHTGRDCFDLQKNLRVFEVADQVSRDTGIPIYHETHRGRCLHSPWRTSELLRARPGTKLVFDMSHWCNVCESLCEDQSETIESVCPAVEHIHARVGHAHGPQVSDPRAPEWQPAVEAHFHWWKKIADLKRHNGDPYLTIAPEFGPPPYLPTLPFTQMPVASQWDINCHMMQWLRARL